MIGIRVGGKIIVPDCHGSLASRFPIPHNSQVLINLTRCPMGGLEYFGLLILVVGVIGLVVLVKGKRPK